MAASYCLAILAGFCFHSSDIDAHLQDVGLGYALTVKTSRYEASTNQTDVIRAFDWRQQPKACAGANCVRYHMNCTTHESAVACNYRIAFIGDASGGTISIRAKDNAGMAAARNEISLWFGSGDEMLALAALTEPSPSAGLAACPADTDPQSCNPR